MACLYSHLNAHIRGLILNGHSSFFDFGLNMRTTVMQNAFMNSNKYARKLKIKENYHSNPIQHIKKMNNLLKCDIPLSEYAAAEYKYVHDNFHDLRNYYAYLDDVLFDIQNENNIDMYLDHSYQARTAEMILDMFPKTKFHHIQKSIYAEKEDILILDSCVQNIQRNSSNGFRSVVILEGCTLGEKYTQQFHDLEGVEYILDHLFEVSEILYE